MEDELEIKNNDKRKDKIEIEKELRGEEIGRSEIGRNEEMIKKDEEDEMMGGKDKIMKRWNKSKKLERKLGKSLNKG